MSDVDEVNFNGPTTAKRTAKKAKAKKRPAASAPAREPKSDLPFPGLTRTACAEACNKDGCAISQNYYCAHPTKGGLQAVDMNNTAALKRMQAARDQINVRIDPDRFK